MKEKSYVAIVSEVVDACSKKWPDPNKCSMCECDSNWYTNMYLDYSNNYISPNVFIESEILPNMEWDTIGEERDIRLASSSLLDMFCGVSHCQPMLSYERIGEICIKILKGEV